MPPEFDHLEKHEDVLIRNGLLVFIKSEKKVPGLEILRAELDRPNSHGCVRVQASHGPMQDILMYPRQSWQRQGKEGDIVLRADDNMHFANEKNLISQVNAILREVQANLLKRKLPGI